MQYIILGLLRHGAARHGYALVKEYRNRSGFRISIGHVYRELQRLLSSGWVRAVENPPGADPRRLPYAITPTGTAAFDAWLAAPAAIVPEECHDELAVRAFFLSENHIASSRDTFGLWREELSVQRRLCERARDEAGRRAMVDEAPSVPMIVPLLSRRLQHITADIAFVDALRAGWPAGQGVTSMEARATVSSPRSRAGAGFKRPSCG